MPYYNTNDNMSTANNPSDHEAPNTDGFIETDGALTTEEAKINETDTAEEIETVKRNIEKNYTPTNIIHTRGTSIRRKSKRFINE